MNEVKIQAIKDALRQFVELISKQENFYTPEIQELLFKTMQHVATRIQELRSQESPVEGLNEMAKQPLQPGPYSSSNINSFKYDPNNGRLLVKFHGKDNANSGPIYGYEGVPKFIYDVFRRGAVGPKTSGSNKYHTWIKGVTPSLGAAMNALVKSGGYNYTKLS